MPVNLAAAALGMSPDALRKRVKRGTAEGCSRGGKVYVRRQWVERMARGRPSARSEEVSVAPAVSGQTALDARFDRLINLQEREQVLRQQMQNVLDRLSRQLEARDQTAADSRQLEDRLLAAERDLGAVKTAIADLLAHLQRGKRERG